jgi:AAA family ATP:ADP antiporter
MSSSEQRDPFPMQSAEAQSLAAESSMLEDGSKWSTMKTSTSIGSSSSGNRQAFYQEPSTSLIGGQSLSEEGEEEEDEKDDYFDRPIHNMYSPRNPWSVWRYASHYTKSHAPSLIQKCLHGLYGKNVPLSEVQRVIILALTLFFMIGGYWLLRSLKDPVLTAICGVEVIPRAKMVSVVVVLLAVSGYNHLLSSNLPKHHLFYIFGSLYFCLFMTIALLLKHPYIGLDNQIPNPNRLLGWISYCTIESFGSIMVSLFWSFSNSVNSLESAKASYGLIVATAQIGSIIGPTIVNLYVEKIGVASCYMIGACAMILLQLTMLLYTSIYGTQVYDIKGGISISDSQPRQSQKSKEAGIFEGLSLFYQYNYIKGIFAVSCLYMIIETIIDYAMKILAKEYYAMEFPCHAGNSCWNASTNEAAGISQEATEAFSTFTALFGQATNTLSFLLSLFGTSAVIRILGLRYTMLLFPILCLLIVILVWLRPTLWVAFGGMIMLKAFSYALNNPTTKELLYQPTSQAVKYKAKSWIDTFGGRGSKALGSLVTNAFSDSATHLVANGSSVGLMAAIFMIFNAWYVGRAFDDYLP